MKIIFQYELVAELFYIISVRVGSCFILFQYELVAELFQEAKPAGTPTGGSRGPPGAGRGPGKPGIVRPAKEVPKSGPKSHKKTVGSQVSSLDIYSCVDFCCLCVFVSFVCVFYCY